MGTPAIDFSKYETTALSANAAPPQIDFTKYEGQQPSGVAAGGGKSKSYLQMALENSPSGADPHNPGNPNLNAVPESQRKNVNDAAFGTEATTLAGEGVGAAAEKIGAKAFGSALRYLGVGEKAGAAASEVSTGLFDPQGNPIMRAVEPEVRPVLQRILSHPAVQAGLKEAGKDILRASGFGAGYEAFRHLF